MEENNMQIKNIDACEKRTTPTIDFVRYGENCKKLNDSINDKDEKNIAISGIFGAGKSSLIKTYKKSYGNQYMTDILSKYDIEKEEDRKKIDNILKSDNLQQNLTKSSITISLANFNVVGRQIQKNDDKEKKDLDDRTKIKEDFKQLNSHYENHSDTLKKSSEIEQDIERNLLQQFLFSKKQKVFSDSRVKRVTSSFGLKVSSFVFFILLISFTSICLINKFDLVWKYNHIVEFVFVILSTICGLVFLSLVPLLFKIKTLKVQNIEISTEERNAGVESLLSKYLDEIIYFFKTNKIKVVYFEDLDRLPNLNIFNKLRQLNFILNNSSEFNEKITFIYCISDSIMADYEERAKFFDNIITIEPYVDFENLKKTIKFNIDSIKKFEGTDNEKVDEFASDMSKFMVDSRLSVYIKRDLQELIRIYEQNSDINNITIIELIKIYTLSIYKNLYYFDYNKLSNQESCLDKSFELIRYIKQDLIKRNLESIDELEEVLKSSSYHEDFDSILQEIESLRKNNDRINSMSVSEFMNEFDCSDISNKFLNLCLKKGYIENDFRKFLYGINYSFIDESDSAFIRYNNFGELNSPIKGNYSYELKNYSEIIKAIYTDKFSSSKILNISLLNYLINKNKQLSLVEDNKYKEMKNLLFSANDDVNNFYIEYLKTQDEGNCLTITRLFYNSIEFLIAFKNLCGTISLEKQNKIINSLLNETQLDRVPEGSRNEFCDLINNYDSWHDVKISEYAISNLKKVVQVRLKSVKNLDIESIKIVCNNCCFEINIDNLNIIMSVLLNENEPGKYLNRILNLEQVDLFNYFMDNIDYLLKLLENQVVSNDNVYKVLNNQEIEDETKTNFIEKVNFDFEIKDNIDVNLLKLIIENEKLSFDILNIFKAFVIDKTQEFENYFNKANFQRISFEKLSEIQEDANYQNFLNRVVFPKLLQENNIEIAKSFNLSNLTLWEISKEFENHLRRLINNNIVEFSAKNLNNIVDCRDAYCELIKNNETEFIEFLKQNKLNLNDELFTYIICKTKNIFLKSYLINNYPDKIIFDYKDSQNNYYQNIITSIKEIKVTNKLVIEKMMATFSNEYDYGKEMFSEIITKNNDVFNDINELFNVIIKIDDYFEQFKQDYAIIDQDQPQFIFDILNMLENRNILKKDRRGLKDNKVKYINLINKKK